MYYYIAYFPDKNGAVTQCLFVQVILFRPVYLCLLIPIYLSVSFLKLGNFHFLCHYLLVHIVLYSQIVVTQVKAGLRTKIEVIKCVRMVPMRSTRRCLKLRTEPVSVFGNFEVSSREEPSKPNQSRPTVMPRKAHAQSMFLRVRVATHHGTPATSSHPIWYWYTEEGKHLAETSY